MKTTVDIPDSLFAEAKAVAKKKGTTLRELITDGLRQTIREASKPAVPFKLKDGSFGGKGLAKDWTWAEIRDEIYKGRGT